MTVTKFGIGQPLRRVEDHRFLTGQGRYTDDHVPAGCLHALVLRSPHAHARFQIADLAKARALPGVKLVLIAHDIGHLGHVPCQAPIPNGDGSQGHVAHIPVLARDLMRFRQVEFSRNLSSRLRKSHVEERQLNDLAPAGSDAVEYQLLTPATVTPTGGTVGREQCFVIS